MFFFFFFNDTATTEIYTLSLHDALPISFRASIRHNIERRQQGPLCLSSLRCWTYAPGHAGSQAAYWRSAAVFLSAPCLSSPRSEEHTSELQSHSDLVCRLLLEIRKAHV